MNKPIVAIVAGGYSGEYDVSLRSAAGILSWIDTSLFTPYIYVVERERWYVRLHDGTTTDVNRATFGFDLDGMHQTPSYAYITIHGTPGEDGVLQGYLDMLHIPYNTGGVLTESLTFNKFYCNRYLSTYPGIRVALSCRLTDTSTSEELSAIIDTIGLPAFVKPNTGGSSVATSRVDEVEAFAPAVQTALSESREVMVERFIAGTEVTCGAYRASAEGEVIALPVTEVVTQNKFFDFDAKYHGQVEEITPARISETLTQQIQQLTRSIYDWVDARGIIRVDYIIEPDGTPTLLEVNTTPGMTPTSFIPQQVRAAGMDMTALLSSLISAGLR